MGNLAPMKSSDLTYSACTLIQVKVGTSVVVRGCLNLASNIQISNTPFSDLGSGWAGWAFAHPIFRGTLVDALIIEPTDS